jgi:putative methionine-R-sulfoxide reductase with GAF domain
LIDQDKKPVLTLDEQTFGKILEAAYVLQEHHRKMREIEENLESQSEQLREEDLVQQALLKKIKPESQEAARPNADYMLTLAEIVEAQHQIQMRHLGLDEAMGVVAERIMRIAKASGAGIGILDGATIRYRAGAGSPALPVGSEVPLRSAICQANIRTGQVIRTKEIDTEFLFDPEPARERGIRSLVAVPIHYDGNIVGSLELYFDKKEGYAEQDIHTCQLMAGLVTEAIGRETGLTLKKSMAEERSTMLAAIEKLQPKLTALAEKPSENAGEESAVATGERAEIVCANCANHLNAEEQFCGKCGAPRPQRLQSSAASAAVGQNEKLRARPGIFTATASGTSAARFGTPGIAAAPIAGHALSENLRDSSSATEISENVLGPMPFTESEAEELVKSLALVAKLDAETRESEDSQNAAPATMDQGAMVWSSAARAQDFLESLSTARTPGALVRFWRSRRGDFYLAIAIAVVIFVIGWGVWSSHSSSAVRATSASLNATRAKKAAADTDLSLFDRLLIGLGLAEAPETPEYKYRGNPDIQVWVDLNTAQYYCPGSDLYEKTAKGKLSTQREAQLDQFEPAYRKACD